MTSFASSIFALSPFIIHSISTVTSPFKSQQRKKVGRAFVVSSHGTVSSSSGSELECDEGSDYKKSENSGNCTTEGDKIEDASFDTSMVKNTEMAIKREPKQFLGLPEKSLHITDMLATRSTTSDYFFGVKENNT
ncbi:hypothetical protein JTB14_038044 [Gonioctena quinquepunctata]|nr:hypothetical protein JTB14_038044 [Gonioctena quinquepunctata]